MAVRGDDETLAGSGVGTTLAGVAPELPETIAGRYQLVRWLGGGGMGRVYEVRDTELDERVALKVLRAGLSDEALERFRREVKLTRRIQHRNVARMFDIGEHHGEKFLTMELVDGAPLTRELGAPLPWPRLQAIAIQLCAGLGAAHAAGVIHRDLKPDNVMVERGTDRAVITDFGIARSGDDASVTQLGVVIGTPRYMAPEQLAGAEVDARADVFSLGVILYELATGKRPWQGDNAITIAVAQVTQPMRPLDGAGLPPAFVAIVESCLALERDARPPSAAVLGVEIAACERPHGVVVPGRSAELRQVPITPTPTPTGQLAHPAVAEDTAIAVLPFTCGAADDYLADGVVEDLIDQLSTTPGLRVRPAGVTRARLEQDPRALGHELAVEHVISGSVRRTPAGLRVSARLIGVVDGFQIWAHRVDCTEPEILTVSEQLGRGIAQALSALSARTSRSSDRIDQEAVDYYLRARAELRRFWGAHADHATELLEKAAAIAPTSGQIISALAFASVHAWIRSDRPEQLARARLAVERGLATGHGEAHLAAAVLKLNQGDPVAAAGDLGIALARAPMSAQAHETLGRLLVEVDAVEEGRRHFDLAIGLDAVRGPNIGVDLARLDAFAGDWDAVDRRLAPLIHDPDVPVMQYGSVNEARLMMWKRDFTRTLAAVSRMPEETRVHGFSLLSIYRTWTMDHTFDLGRWKHQIDEIATPHPDHSRRMQLAALQRFCELIALIEQDEAAEYTFIAITDLGLIDLVWLDRCPLFSALRHRPWWTPLRARVATRAAAVLAAYRAAR